MPPSGYTVDQSSSVINFLVSCANSLEKEGVQKNLSPVDALKSECENINVILGNKNCEYFAGGVLALTHIFYSDLLAKKPKNYDEYRMMVVKALEEAKDEILAVHVPEI